MIVFCIQPSKETEDDEDEPVNKACVPDPLQQLISVFSMSAMTAQWWVIICFLLKVWLQLYQKQIWCMLIFSPMEIDDLYMSYANLMARSCHTGDDEDDEESTGEDDTAKSFEVS